MSFKLTNILFIIVLFFWVSQGVAQTPRPPPSAHLFTLDKTNTTLSYLIGETIVKVNTKSGKLIKRIPIKLSEFYVPFASTPDGYKLLVKSPKGIDVIHNNTGKVLRTLPHPNNAQDWWIEPVISSNSVLMAIADKDQSKIYLVHTGSGKITRTIQVKNISKDTEVKAMAFSNNNRLIAYRTETKRKNTLHVYDINNNIETAAIPLAETRTSDIYGFYGNHIKFNKNGKQIISYSASMPYLGIQLIDLQNQHVTKLKTGDFSFAAFSKDTKKITIVNFNQRLIRNYKLQTGQYEKTVFQVQPHTGFPTIAVQSNDGAQIILASSYGRNFIIIDSNTGRVIRTINFPPDN